MTVGDELLDEVDLKLDRLEAGESTVAGETEGYAEFWRRQVREADVDGDVSRDETATDAAGGE